MNGSADRAVPLCVDLDGTLVRTDLLLESFLTLLREQPLQALRAPLWLAGGKARLKAEIASRVDFSTIELPYRPEIVELIERERGAGRPTVLVTGSHQSLADAVAARAPLFDEVRGSDERVNLTAERKRDWLVSRFGQGGFDYIGNDRDDLRVWPSARRAIAVSSSDGVAADPSIGFERVIDDPKPGFQDYLNLMRVHQWSKNALIAVPFLLDQRFGDPRATFAVVLGFFAMSLLASATYIVNDMLDLQADRRNSTKRHRALASGTVSIARGAVAAGVLGFVALVLALMLPPMFQLALAVYLVLTLSYSFALKRKAMLDVIMLAALHTLRVVAGTLAIGAEWSFWLLAFSLFVFFSLALAKRVAELANLALAGRDMAPGRGYTVGDRAFLTMVGVSTGYLSVLVVALYINSAKVLRVYSEPMLLWLVCPVLMYWIGRIWLETSRGNMHEDPIVFALKDRESLYTAIVLGAIVMLAMVL